MAKKTTTRKTSSSKPTVTHSGLPILEVANRVHHTVARHCANCGRPMTLSDVNDYGTLCESCYMKEYYND